jgi:hypothetical protein
MVRSKIREVLEARDRSAYRLGKEVKLSWLTT